MALGQFQQRKKISYGIKGLRHPYLGENDLIRDRDGPKRNSDCPRGPVPQPQS